ncbi:putative aldo/keto reductase [Paraphaeosphaeria sporulosa]
MATASKSTMPVVLDVMTIGKAGVEGVRVSDLKDVNLMLDVSQSIGHNEIDDARLYGGESSELYPNEGKGNMGDNVYSHRPEDVRRGLLASLKAIETEKVEKWYLHGPDHTTNYMSWEAAAICEICERNGWIKPAIYQGMYNVLHQNIEPGLMPCLRKYGIALHAFQPLAGGFPTSMYKRDMKEDDDESGSRVDPKQWQVSYTKAVTLKTPNSRLFDIIRPVAGRSSTSMPQRSKATSRSKFSAMQKARKNSST